MSTTIIFLVGLFTTSLCVLFVVGTIIEMKAIEEAAESEALHKNSPLGSSSVTESHG